MACIKLSHIVFSVDCPPPVIDSSCCGSDCLCFFLLPLSIKPITSRDALVCWFAFYWATINHFIFQGGKSPVRTYTWGRIPSDYIPFDEYDMPANAATSTDVQSDAFAEVVLANLIAPIQEDKKNPKRFHKYSMEALSLDTSLHQSRRLYRHESWT